MKIGKLYNFNMHKIPTIALSFCVILLLLLSQITYATLPPPVYDALLSANLSPDDISLVIIPLPNPSSSADQNSTNIANDANITTPNLSASRLPITRSTSSSDSDLNKSTNFYINAQPIIEPVRHNATVPRTPASTMKLIPTFIALDTLGSDFTWVTKAYHTGYIVNQTLHGDLIIKGSGDPKLTHTQLDKLMVQIQQADITHIKGDIILDTSLFQQVGKNPAAFDNEPLRPYNASPDGFLVNFNSIEIQTLPLGSRRSLLTYSPKLADYHLPKYIAQRSGRCQSIRYSLAPVWQPNRLMFNKSLPSSCGIHTFYIAHPDVKAFSRYVVKQKWLALGNTLSGEIISTEQPKLGDYNQYIARQSKPFYDHSSSPLLSASLLPLTTLTSFPLSQQIYDINHHSNNVMAEQLTLSIPAYAEDAPRTITYKGALMAIDTWWQTNLESPTPVMSNGSGLCRDCRVSAQALSELLSYAYYHPEFDTYVDSLGQAGIDGTIATHKWRLPNSAAIGRAWIKTGTLDTVTAMAGYVKGYSNQDYVVVGIINTPYKLNTTNARRVLDTMLDWTAQH